MKVAGRFVVGSVLLSLVLGVVARAADGPAKLVGPFATDEYPQAVIDRPLTLPAGMVEAEVGGQFTSATLDGEPLGVRGADAWDALVALRVGVTDRVQLEAGAAFSLDYVQRYDAFGYQGYVPPDVRPSLTSWRREVPLRLSFLALDTETLDTAVALTLPFVGHSERTIQQRHGSVTFSTGDGRILPAVLFSAPTRWRLTDWLWLRAGENLFGVTTGDGTARFAFDFGVGIQPHRMFAATFDARVARVTFDGGGEEGSRTITDASPVTLTGIFTPVSCLDLVGALDLADAGDGFDTYAIRTSVRLRF